MKHCHVHTGKFPFIYSETGKDLLAKGHLMRHRHIHIAELTEVRQEKI